MLNGNIYFGQIMTRYDFQEARRVVTFEQCKNIEVGLIILPFWQNLHLIRPIITYIKSRQVILEKLEEDNNAPKTIYLG